MSDSALSAFLKQGSPACPTCGHGLAGLSKPVCPECGATLTLGLVAPSKSIPGLGLRALLWWVLALGVVTLGLNFWMTWEMHQPLKAMGASLRQPVPGYFEFWRNVNLSLSLGGLYTALQLVAILGSAGFQAALSRSAGNRSVQRLARVFCIAALVTCLAMLVLEFL